MMIVLVGTRWHCTGSLSIRTSLRFLKARFETKFAQARARCRLGPKYMPRNTSRLRACSKIKVNTRRISRCCRSVLLLLQHCGIAYHEIHFGLIKRSVLDPCLERESTITLPARPAPGILAHASASQRHINTATPRDQTLPCQTFQPLGILSMSPTLTSLVPHLGGTKAGYRLSNNKYDASKPTCVLLNSMCMTVALYNEQFADPKLTDAMNLLAIEPLGHGATSSPAEHFSYWDSATVALQVMDNLGIDKAFVLGTSQGGWIVVRMALLAPDRVRRSLFPFWSCLSCGRRECDSVIRADGDADSWSHGSWVFDGP